VTASHGQPVAHEPLPTRERIIEATISCVARDGAAETSMSVIAAGAGVSKALLHYHYSDRARLLAEVVAQVGERLAARERLALQGADGRRAMDALWRWLERELARGELRALLELSLVRDPLVHEAAIGVAAQRRVDATRTATTLLAQLGLEPRVPAELLGEASVAFVDGLVMSGLVATRAPRAAFDVFWLAMLGLAE
jgi:AcrR family transcriptional regulator